MAEGLFCGLLDVRPSIVGQAIANALFGNLFTMLLGEGGLLKCGIEVMREMCCKSAAEVLQGQGGVRARAVSMVLHCDALLLCMGLVRVPFLIPLL